MNYREDERRWKQMMDILTAESNGREPKPFTSQRTLFGIPSEVEKSLEALVAADEQAQRERLAEEAKAQGALETVQHPLDPIYDQHSEILILGTMPSPVSREVGFYYGHPQNRFWRVLAALFDEPVAQTNEQRTDQLLRHHIALWDVLASCTIHGASDASISDAVPNDFSSILATAPIRAVFCTGAKATELYNKFCAEETGIPAIKLPSTSAANAACRLPALVSAYRAILPYLTPPTLPDLNVDAVVALEQRIAAAGTPLAELMERAGCSVAHRAHELWRQRVEHAGSTQVCWEEATREALDLDDCARRGTLTILCGSGNNGGDGWVAARDLAALGHHVILVSLKAPEDLHAEPARETALGLAPVLEEAGVTVEINPSLDRLKELLAKSDGVIDGLLGTGFTGTEVRNPLDEWIEAVNRQHARGSFVLAIDVPSGLSAQTGSAAATTICATATATMLVAKPGLLTEEALPFVGNLFVEPLAYLEPLLTGEEGPSSGIAAAPTKEQTPPQP